MPSFTSSSDRAPIAAAVGLALALVLAWTAVVQTGFLPAGPRTNLARMQGWLHEEGRRAEVVLLGSSMTGRLLPDDLPAGWYNLGLESSNAITGLAVVARGTQAPAVALVEANETLYRGTRANLLALLDTPTARLAAWFPVLRDRNRPVSVVRGAMGHVLALRRRARHGAAVERPDPEKVRRGTAMYAARSARSPFGLVEAEANLASLAAGLEALAARGTRVVLFEPPAAPELASMPFQTTARRSIAARFPAPAWRWVRPAAGVRYETTDGLHLSRAGARAFLAGLEPAVAAARGQRPSASR